MTTAILGLGGNIGDSRALMASAVALLGERPDVHVEAVSPLYRTPPWGKTDQPDFLNAAVRIETTLPPLALLEAVLDIERRLGRERAERWGPRTLDIDILLFGGESIDAPGLHVPHPRLAERAFALRPLVDVDPAASFNGRPAAAWLAQTDAAGMTMLAGPGWHERAAPARKGR